MKNVASLIKNIESQKHHTNDGSLKIVLNNCSGQNKKDYFEMDPYLVDMLPGITCCILNSLKCHKLNRHAYQCDENKTETDIVIQWQKSTDI